MCINYADICARAHAHARNIHIHTCVRVCARARRGVRAYVRA